jgi:DNA processing protein
MDWKAYPVYTSFWKKTKIFYRGNFEKKLFSRSLAVVGSRAMTRYGQEVLERIIPDLVASGVTIISGFMYGIDTLAHRLTIEAGGTTVAVFGCGINICYPPENDGLYTRILEKGAVLSEYQPNQKPQLWMFARRNRLVADLASLGVLVVEAGINSGSLITANFARCQRKKVWAIPGPITSSASVGTNMLIKKGEATLVTEAADILGNQFFHKQSTKNPQLSGLEKRIYDVLSREPATPDELAQELGENIVTLSQTLSLMSLAGLVTEAGGKFYRT